MASFRRASSSLAQDIVARLFTQQQKMKEDPSRIPQSLLLR